MAEREIVTEREVTTASGGNTVASVVYALFTVLEVFLLFRFFFKLFGANPGNGFVNFIYSASQPFVAPFYGIFGQATTQGSVVQAVFEPAILIAIVVYAVIAWLIVALLTAGSRRAV